MSTLRVERACSDLPVYCLLYSVSALRTPIKTKLLIVTFLLYLGVVAALTIVPTHITGFKNPHSYHINLVPLGYSVKCFFLDPRHHQRPFCLRNTLGNLALFLPLGILLPLVSNQFRTLKRVLLTALCLSVSIETIQFVLRFFGNPRAVDIDDVILNTLGACVGFAVFRYGIKKTGEKVIVMSDEY